MARIRASPVKMQTSCHRPAAGLGTHQRTHVARHLTSVNYFALARSPHERTINRSKKAHPLRETTQPKIRHGEVANNANHPNTASQMIIQSTEGA